MTIEILSVFTACGIVVAFGIGFFIGIGYQKAEDVRALRIMKDSCKKELAQMKAFYEGRADRMHQFYETKMDETYKATSDILDALSTGNIDETKFGGF